MKQNLFQQRGFTLIELLAVMAILGLLAAVIIPNVTAFMTTGDLAGANQELLAVRTASVGYLGDHSLWPVSSDNLGPWVTTSELRARYIFDITDDGTGPGPGFISAADPLTSNGWPDRIHFYADSQKWERTR